MVQRDAELGGNESGTALRILKLHGTPTRTGFQPSGGVSDTSNPSDFRFEFSGMTGQRIQRIGILLYGNPDNR